MIFLNIITCTWFPPLGAGAHLQHCPVGREGSRAPCLSWRCGCAGCTRRANYDDDDDDNTDDDDDDDSDGDGGDNGGRWWSFVNNAVFHYVTNKGKLCYVFKFGALLMFMMMMMLLMTMMMLIKRSNSTAPWNWFHEPIPQHRETNSMMYVKLVRETKSTAPWNQFHEAVEFNCKLKPQLHGAVEYFPRASEQIPRTFWKTWCHGIDITDYTDPWN